MVKSNFGLTVRSARVKRGLTAQKLAARIGVSPSTIYFWETDQCRPRSENLSALCRELKLPVRATREQAAA